jgi:hypothetical protein
MATVIVATLEGSLMMITTSGECQMPDCGAP